MKLWAWPLLAALLLAAVASAGPPLEKAGARATEAPGVPARARPGLAPREPEPAANAAAELDPAARASRQTADWQASIANLRPSALMTKPALPGAVATSSDTAVATSVPASSSSSSGKRDKQRETQAAPDPVAPLVLVQALRPSGLRFSIADQPGAELVLVHANINLPLDAEERGQLSGNVLKPKDGFWTLLLSDVQLQPGDVVFYWVHVRARGKGKSFPTSVAKITGRVDSSCAPSVTTINSGQVTCKGQLVFEEQFNSLTGWQHEVRFSSNYDRDFSIYTASTDNSFVDNGILHIRPSQVPDDIVNGELTLEGCTSKEGGRECSRKAAAWDLLPPVYSAWLTTRDIFTFRYGRVALRAKMAVGDWLFNHAFLERLDVPFSEEAQETARLNVAWLRGNANLTDTEGNAVGARRLFPNVALAYCFRKLVLGLDVDLLPHVLWTDEYHEFGATWTPDEVVFTVDERVTHSVKAPEEGFTSMAFFEDCPKHNRGKIAPLDQEMFLNIALRVGNTHGFPPGLISAGQPKPWNDKDPKANLKFWKDKTNWLPTWSSNSEIKVDWVRVWAL